MIFFTLLNGSNGTIVYAHAVKNSELIKCINCYLRDKKNSKQLHLIYSSNEGRIEINNTLIKLYYSSSNFAPALQAQNYFKDKFASKLNLKEKYVSLYEKILLPLDQINEKFLKLNKKINITNLNNAIQKSKNEIFVLGLHVDNNPTIDALIKFIKTNIYWSRDFNFNNFFSLYNIPKHSHLFDKAHYKTVVFENVYYRNKGFYNADGTFFDITEIHQDIEYKNYNETKLKIDTKNAVQVTEPVLFLDYIYDFYNFGEFWDIVKRLIFFDKREKVEIYGLTQNRILNIQQYFSAFNIIYPPKYCRDYNTIDEQRETNRGKTFFFKKIYLSTINNTCRSSLDPWVLFEMNNIFNKNETNNKNYCLYLSRGKMKRGMLNEEKLITALADIDNIKIINGDESFEEQQYYFTNAKLIFGIHGALQGNFVWNKNNFTFLELTPYQRCAQLSHFGDSYDCGFKSIIIPCDADDEERIILSDENINNLCELIKIII